jgi:branched-chain amino acid transport system substrate-binding protein
VSELDRRQVLRLFAALGLAGATAPALSSCGVSAATPTSTVPVRIGLIVPQAGANKAIGDDLTAGFQLYLTLHGTQLGGHPVQLTMVEEGDSAESGRAAVDKLVKDHGVQAITGVASSTVMTGIRDQIEAAQVPLLGSNASPSSLGSVKYIWRTSYVNTEAGQALGGYLAVRRNLSTFVISDDAPTSREQVSGFLSTYNGVLGHAELADDPVQVPLLSNPGMSLTSAFNAIRNSGARAVFAAFAPETAPALLKAYRSAGLTAAIYAPGFVSEGTTALHGLGEAASGHYTAMNYAPDLDNSANRTFASEYQKQYNTPPSTYAMASYDAAAVLDKALQLAGGDLAPQSVNTALSQVGQIDSPRGGWQFNQSRTPLQRWYLRQVRKAGQVLTNTLLGDLAMLG